MVPPTTRGTRSIYPTQTTPRSGVELGKMVQLGGAAAMVRTGIETPSMASIRYYFALDEDVLELSCTC